MEEYIDASRSKHNGSNSLDQLATSILDPTFWLDVSFEYFYLPRVRFQEVDISNLHRHTSETMMVDRLQETSRPSDFVHVKKSRETKRDEGYIFEVYIKEGGVFYRI